MTNDINNIYAQYEVAARTDSLMTAAEYQAYTDDVMAQIQAELDGEQAYLSHLENRGWEDAMEQEHWESVRGCY